MPASRWCTASTLFEGARGPTSSICCRSLFITAQRMFYTGLLAQAQLTGWVTALNILSSPCRATALIAAVDVVPRRLLGIVGPMLDHAVEVFLVMHLCRWSSWPQLLPRHADGVAAPAAWQSAARFGCSPSPRWRKRPTSACGSITSRPPHPPARIRGGDSRRTIGHTRVGRLAAA